MSGKPGPPNCARGTFGEAFVATSVTEIRHAAFSGAKPIKSLNISVCMRDQGADRGWHLLKS